MTGSDQLPFAEAYCLVDQLYAFQSQVLDDGDTTAWAATFSTQIKYASQGPEGAAANRAELAENMARDVADLASLGVARRRMVTNIRLGAISADALEASSYIQVIDTVNGRAQITRSEVVHDLLRRESTWLVRCREVLCDNAARQDVG